MKPEKPELFDGYRMLVRKGKELILNLPCSSGYEIICETHHGRCETAWYWRNKTKTRKSQAFERELEAVGDLIDHLKSEFARHKFLKKTNTLRARNRRRWTKHNPRR